MVASPSAASMKFVTYCLRPKRSSPIHFMVRSCLARFLGEKPVPSTQSWVISISVSVSFSAMRVSYLAARRPAGLFLVAVSILSLRVVVVGAGCRPPSLSCFKRGLGVNRAPRLPPRSYRSPNGLQSDRACSYALRASSHLARRSLIVSRS